MNKIIPANYGSIGHLSNSKLTQQADKKINAGMEKILTESVRGKGNPESFMSCSHGAGRRMGRKEAVRSLNLEEEKKKLEDKGILHAILGKDDLEEAAGAYKDIDVVMAEQADLVDILVELQPLAVVKG